METCHVMPIVGQRDWKYSVQNTAYFVPRTHSRVRRAGFVVVAILALLAVATTLFAIWTHTAIREQRQLQLREYDLQARRLAEAGIRRGLMRLEAAAAYQGETWQIPPESMGANHAASVRIDVEPSTEDSPIQIMVTAFYPHGIPHRARRAETLLVSSRRPGENDPNQTTSESGDQP